jgi:hypothetical protein
MNNTEWSSLFDQFYPKKLDYEKNKHLFTKLAFDVFQLNGSPVKSLWILEDGEDGKQYLSATYDSSEEQLEITGQWNALVNKEASMVVLYYKGYPIQKFESQIFGFTKESADAFSEMIVKKANSDDKFVKTIIESQNKEKQEIIIKQFPELNK